MVPGGAGHRVALGRPRDDRRRPRDHRRISPTPRRSAMKAGIVINAGGARDQVELAERAEIAGWDGVFTYDAIEIGGAEMFDPWTLLAAMALRTTRVRLGAVVIAP